MLGYNFSLMNGHDLVFFVDFRGRTKFKKKSKI